MVKMKEAGGVVVVVVVDTSRKQILIERQAETTNLRSGMAL